MILELESIEAPKNKRFNFFKLHCEVGVSLDCGWIVSHSSECYIVLDLSSKCDLFSFV